MKYTIDNILNGQLSDGKLFSALLILTSEELDQLVSRYNWDDGYEIPWVILRLPNCDKGSILKLYWRSGAQWYRQFSTRDEIDSEEQRKGWDFCLKIEQMIENNEFPTHKFLFNPRNDDGMDYTLDYLDCPEKRIIPIGMFAPYSPPQDLNDRLIEECIIYAKKINLEKPIPHAIKYLKSVCKGNINYESVYEIIKQKLNVA